jgi:chromosome segregation ATPase
VDDCLLVNVSSCTSAPARDLDAAEGAMAPVPRLQLPPAPPRPASGSAAGRKLALGLEEERKALLKEVRTLSAGTSRRDTLLEQQGQAHAALETEAAGLQESVRSLRGALADRDALISVLQHELGEERRTSARYLHEITTSEKMLSTICAYRTSDDMRDRSALLQENLGLEEKVLQLKTQLRRLAFASVAAIDDD